MKAMNITFEQKSEVYPDYVFNGVKESLKQAEEGKLTPYTGIKNMLNHEMHEFVNFLYTACARNADINL